MKITIPCFLQLYSIQCIEFQIDPRNCFTISVFKHFPILENKSKSVLSTSFNYLIKVSTCCYGCYIHETNCQMEILLKHFRRYFNSLFDY